MKQITLFSVLFDDEAEGFGGDNQVVIVLHLVENLPHGLVLLGAGKGFGELFELEGGGAVGGVVGAGPVEEAEGLGAEPVAGSEDAEDEVGFDGGDAELVEGSLHVEVALHDVRDVMDGREVVVLGRGGGFGDVLVVAAINGGGG